MSLSDFTIGYESDWSAYYDFFGDLRRDLTITDDGPLVVVSTDFIGEDGIPRTTVAGEGARIIEAWDGVAPPRAFHYDNASRYLGFGPDPIDDVAPLPGADAVVAIRTGSGTVGVGNNAMIDTGSTVAFTDYPDAETRPKVGDALILAVLVRPASMFVPGTGIVYDTPETISGPVGSVGLDYLTVASNPSTNPNEILYRIWMGYWPVPSGWDGTAPTATLSGSAVWWSDTATWISDARRVAPLRQLQRDDRYRRGSSKQSSLRQGWKGTYL